MKNKKKQIKFLADPYFFSMVLLGWIALWGGGIAGLVLLFNPTYSADQMFSFGWCICFGWCLFFIIMPPCVWLIHDLRWITVITLTEDNIQIRMGYKKPSIYPYSHFPYITSAYYVQSMVGTPDFGPKVRYIVLSNRRLTDVERRHANYIGYSSEMIRIKYTDRTYRFLLEAMPLQKSKQLECIVNPEAYQPSHYPPKKRKKEKRKKK